MKCRLVKCNNDIFKYHLCKEHYLKRKTFYKYQGHIADLKIEAIQRKCLQCERLFMSVGNRKCTPCNEITYDDTNHNVSLFIACS